MPAGGECRAEAGNCGSASGDRSAQGCEAPTGDPAERHGTEDWTKLAGSGKRGKKHCKTERLVIHEERIVKVDVPVGSRFKGYEDFVVQDLVLRPHVVRIRRERWLTPVGETVVAPMPAEITDHFGPELRRFVLLRYRQGQVTMPRLVSQLRAIGIVDLQAPGRPSAECGHRPLRR